jgi:hypothetical protein
MVRRSVYSHYLPLKRHGRAASRAAANKESLRSPTKDTKEKDNNKGGRASSQSQTSKRRSTLNSREAGYDEAEALRKAIEASKEDAFPPDQQESRRPKRGRSDSQEYAYSMRLEVRVRAADTLLRKSDNAKRQKTSSRSASPVSDKNADDSDDGGATGRNGTRAKSRNTASARNQRSEKASEEERERQRADAANKRKGRADRRGGRGDGTVPSRIVAQSLGARANDDLSDSDPSEEMPLAARAATNKTAPQASSTTTSPTNATAPSAPDPPSKPPTTSAVEPAPAPNSVPDTPTPPSAPVQSKTDNNKKRSHKKKGRNQYTRDRDAHDDESPGRSQSRDIQKDEPGSGNGGAVGGPTSGGGGSGTKQSGDGVTKSSSKSKGGMSSKITMNDMKRRAAALLEFISRTQLELAGEAAQEIPAAPAAAASTTNGDATSAVSVVVTSPDEKPKDGTGSDAPEKDFKELGCLEMMDSLTRRLVKWQQQYAN